MEESRIDTFNRNVGLLQSLYDQLETNDRSLALDQLKTLLSNCEKKLACRKEGDISFKEYQIAVSNAGGHIGLLPPTQLEVKPLKGMSVESTTEFLAQLQKELEQLREENHKLQTELEKLSPRLKECYKPESIVKSIINDILLKVVPPDAPRRVGRPRKNPPKPDSDAATVTTMPYRVQETKPLVAPPTEPVVKRKRGRPRKNPLPPDNTVSPSFRTEINTSTVKRKYVEIEKLLEDNSDTHPCKRMTDEVVVKKEQETTTENQDATTGNRLRTRKPKVERSVSTGEIDDDAGIPDFLDDDSDSESELPFSFRKRPSVLSGSSRPKFNLTGLAKRPRGRPRKNPIRDPSTIKRHKRIIRHVCKICNAQFLHGRPFHRHLSMRHNGDGGPTSCLRCKKEFENHAHYLHHKCELDTNRPDRSCKHCDAKFKSFKSLQEHVQKIHGLKTIDPIYFCKYCQKGFIRRPSLVHHLRSHAEGSYVCDKCGEFSVTEEEHAAHMEKHRRPSTGSMHCERCGAVFDRRQQFEQHIAAHEKYDCSICNKAFSRKKALLKHVRDIHGIKVSMEEKKHQCQVCGRTFNRPGQLEIHTRVHTGERPIECSTCRMFFKSTKALWKHRQTHTHLTKEGALPLEKDHLCAICGKAYFRKQALQRHMRYHDDSKPFKCPHCQYRCRDLNNLKRHVSLHFSSRQFVCEICGSAFHAKKTLETHNLYKHSNDRMHSCPECPMTFKTPNSLRRHKVIHATVRPFKCQSCNMGFNRLYNLRRHMKGVHGSDESLPSVNRVKVIDVPQSQQYLKGATIHSKQSKAAMSQAEFFSKQTEPFLLKEEGDGMSTPPPHAVDPADLLSRPPVPLSIPHILGHHPSTSHMFLPAQVAAYTGENTGGLDMPTNSQAMTITPLHALHIPGPYIHQPARGYLTITPSTSPSPSPHLQPPALASIPHHQDEQEHHHQQQQQQHQQQEQQPERQEQHQILVTQPREEGLQRISYTTEMYSPVGNILHLMNNDS